MVLRPQAGPLTAAKAAFDRRWRVCLPTRHGYRQAPEKVCRWNGQICLCDLLGSCMKRHARYATALGSRRAHTATSTLARPLVDAFALNRGAGSPSPRRALARKTRLTGAVLAAKVCR